MSNLEICHHGEFGSICEKCQNAELQNKLNDPLTGLVAIKRNAEQSSLNIKWLMDKTDKVCYTLDPDFIGTWQERAKNAVAYALKYREALEKIFQILPMGYTTRERECFEIVKEILKEK